MQYEIENFEHYLEESFGNIMLCFRCDIHFTGKDELFIKQYPVAFSIIRKFIAEKYPAFNKFLDDTRNSLDEWGVQEGLMYDALGEEGQGLLYQYGLEYVLQADWVMPLGDKDSFWRKGSSKKDMDKLVDFLEKLSEKKAVADKEEKLSNKFKKRVDVMLREIALEIYPEIMDADPDQLKEMKHLFQREVIAIDERLGKYLQRINKEK